MLSVTFSNTQCTTLQPPPKNGMLNQSVICQSWWSWACAFAVIPSYYCKFDNDILRCKHESDITFNLFPALHVPQEHDRQYMHIGTMVEFAFALVGKLDVINKHSFNDFRLRIGENISSQHKYEHKCDFFFLPSCLRVIAKADDVWLF